MRLLQVSIIGPLLLCLSQVCLAADQWRFGPGIDVTPGQDFNAFVHLDGAGRKHVAVSGNRVAAVWEDDRSGDPQIYLADKSRQADRFSSAVQISNGSEAYEPGIAALPEDGMIIAWEQDGQVWLRASHAGELSNPLKVSNGTAGHAAVAAHEDHIYASWRERRNRQWYLMVARLELGDQGALALVEKTSIESKGLRQPVLLPSLAVSEQGVGVAWEDRRAGHTRLLYSFSGPDLVFDVPQNLNEYFSNRNEYDKGNGVTRVSISTYYGTEVIAAWMDKRRGSVGYGIFASLGDFDSRSFGPNEKAHGEPGDQQPHYNPATAGNDEGLFVIAWDDFRTGNSDIWLSNYTEDETWSEDISPAAASGSAEQSHPSVFVDELGHLHLLWIERKDLNAPGRLRYSYGKIAD